MQAINWLKDKKSIASKQSQSSTMKNLRIIKKTNQLYKSVQSHSRQIITNIFSSVTSNNDKLQLQLKVKDWEHSYVNTALNSQALLLEKKQQKPLTNLLILLRHLSQGFYIQTCSFIFLDKDAIYLAEKDQTLRIEKAKKEKGKLKYWLSHLYFNRIKGKLGEELLQDFKVSGELIHHNEERQYMPSCVLGRSQHTPIVRGVKITRSSMYRSHSQQQQPFCVIHYHNSNQQLLTLSQALSFIDYPFNMMQVSYFQVLPKLKDASNSITTHYSKQKQKIEQKMQLDKLKRIFAKQDHWQMLKDDLEDLKNNLLKSNKYQSYSQLIMLQMIAFIQTKNHVQVKQIKLQWVINKQNQLVLSNAEVYRLVEGTRNTQNNDGLVTLYEKCQFTRLKTNPIKESNSRYTPFKKMKSQEKYKNKSQSKLPLLRWQKKIVTEDIPIKKKANSCVLRIAHKSRSPF